MLISQTQEDKILHGVIYMWKLKCWSQRRGKCSIVIRRSLKWELEWDEEVVNTHRIQLDRKINF